jgi:LPXTG-site transpeptidase (sortase) family protein
MEVKNWSELTDAILLRKTAFLLAFFGAFFITYAVLAALNWLPELVTENESAESVSVTEVEMNEAPLLPAVVEEPARPAFIPSTPDLPLSLRISSLDKEVSVLNPNSRIVSDLDAALLEGVVRHPDSAALNQNGTVFILGHSSYLPAVKNKNFQAFNGIQNLKWGDEIIIESLEVVYTYKIEKVYRAKAQDVTVPIAGDEKRLVLATCNSFGTTDDRYIVEAILVEESAK